MWTRIMRLIGRCMFDFGGGLVGTGWRCVAAWHPIGVAGWISRWSFATVLWPAWIGFSGYLFG